MLFLLVFIIVFSLWTWKLNQHKIPGIYELIHRRKTTFLHDQFPSFLHHLGPTSFPFWGSLITMTMFDNLCLRFPYRVMHRCVDKCTLSLHSIAVHCTVQVQKRFPMFSQINIY